MKRQSVFTTASIFFVIAVISWKSFGAPFQAFAQTDIHITDPHVGFPIALPQLCDSGGANEYATRIPEIISRNLQISGIFKVINPASFLETPGKCIAPDKVGYSDWSVIGAEGLVRGQITFNGSQVQAELYLHDVAQQRAVIGKRYETDAGDYAKIAHRFSNEIIKYFTGEAGVFGTSLVYVSRVGRFKELFRMDLDGSNVHQLTSDKGLAISPSWSPSGDRIVYTSYRSRTPELYFLSPEGGTPRILAQRPGLEIGAKFSRDGGTLFSSATISGVSKIVQFDLKGKLLRKLTEGVAIDVSPSLSPDGQQFAFCSNRSGGPQIYISADGGKDARRISFTDSNYCTSPAWSPKGDKLAFVCRKDGGNQLFVTGPDGSQGAVQLTSSGDNEDPAWSPDGRFIAFSSNFGGGPKGVAILSLLGGRPTRVSSGQSDDSQPAWSPVVN